MVSTQSAWAHKSRRCETKQALAIATLFIRAKIASGIDTLTRAVEARNAAAAKQDKVVDGGEGDRRWALKSLRNKVFSKVNEHPYQQNLFSVCSIHKPHSSSEIEASYQLYGACNATYVFGPTW
jgi:hypothetical protein